MPAVPRSMCAIVDIGAGTGIGVGSGEGIGVSAGSGVTSSCSAFTFNALSRIVIRKDYYETCQMCNHEGIRYVHIMQHPEYHSELRVGQQCAVNMENDYLNPKERETKLKNKHNREKPL